MRDEVLVEILYDAADAVRKALDGLGEWGLAGTKDGQYHSDLVADEVAVTVLERGGLAVLSEETGRRPSESSLLAVLDPVDGSTNASLGLPWFATSICVVDGDGPRAAVVVNQSTGTRYDAIRGAGARCDGKPIRPSGCRSPESAIVGVSGLPPHALGWRQFRALGAAALDLCAVASGMLDGYVDCIRDAHGPWDYLGGALVCLEAGAPVVDAHGRDLVCREHVDRRTPVAAATPELLARLVAERASF